MARRVFLIFLIGDDIMWDNFRRFHPRICDAIEWGCVILSAAAFLLALAVYLR